MIVFPTDPPPEITPMLQIEKGDAANVSKICMGTHTGTHVDPPVHFIEGGATIDRIPPSCMVGWCDVVDVADASSISVREVKNADITHSIVLFKTRNSQMWKLGEFREDFTYITFEAAEYLIDLGVHAVGIDYLSVEAFGSTVAKTHHVFLENSVVLIEGLNLEGVCEGEYFLVCLPLKIEQGDGGPARAVLIEDLL
jgi:arylformamidase